MDCSLPGSSILPGTSPARMLEWVAISFPGDLLHPGIQPASLASPSLAGEFFTTVSPSSPHTSYSCLEMGSLVSFWAIDTCVQATFSAYTPITWPPMAPSTLKGEWCSRETALEAVTLGSFPAFCLLPLILNISLSWFLDFSSHVCINSWYHFVKTMDNNSSQWALNNLNIWLQWRWPQPAHLFELRKGFLH